MSIEEKMDMLRRKIKAGALGADDARRALRAEIDGELRKAPADVDMDAVNACEALLAELSGAKEGTHAAQNLRAIREKLHPQRRAPGRSAAVAALLAASAVSVAGLLGFVGLIAPHIVRIVIGSDNRFLIPASALFGGIMVVGCDTVGRMAMDPSELPVGVIMSLLGPPFFLWLLRRHSYEA